MPEKVTDDRHSVWSNFEIADMDFWRGEAYTKFFNYLENTGGFYYEASSRYLFSPLVSSDRAQRWGDAPIHSIAAALFTRKDQIHFFKDIGELWPYRFLVMTNPLEGYKHAEFAHCPQGRQWREGHCSCNPNDNFGAIIHHDRILAILKKWPRFCAELVPEAFHAVGRLDVRLVIPTPRQPFIYEGR